MDKIEWCINNHQKTNHFYDKYLPYEFHLRMVVNVFKDFSYLLPNNMFAYNTTNKIIELACWGHDLIEDCRVSYDNCKENLGIESAEIIRAVTNYGRGRNRDERMPDYVYEDIRNTPGATFVKMCDRIANSQYSKMTGSSMFNKYQEENIKFTRLVNASKYEDMEQYLIKLFIN